MRRYGYQYKSRFQRDEGQTSRLIRLLNLLVLIASVSVFVLLILSGVKALRENLIQKKIISPVNQTIASSVDGVKNIFFPIKLDYVVKRALTGADGTYAVVVKNLKTQETYSYNQDRVFQSASLYKLWVMATVVRQIEKGTLDPNKFLTDEVVHLNKTFGIASESAELTNGTVSARITDALKQMIVISNNYAALLLVREVKLSTVTKFLSDFDFIHSKTGSPPRTTAQDIADFYESLYKGVLADKESTKTMIDLLKQQTLNDRIPKYLPEGLTIAHKTGELDGNKHDAGIVFTPKGDYIIVIMSDTKNESIAAEREALLSKAVYDYFDKK